MRHPSSLDSLIDALRCMPGVGPKSAQRIAYYLLHRDREGAERLHQALGNALAVIRHCQRCNDFSDIDLCERCASPKRDATQLCIVETPVDMNMVEMAHAYNGLYYVLMGHLSPLDGVGAKALQLSKVVERVSDGLVKEVVLATNFTNEGEATAHFLSELLGRLGIKVTRIARGIPVGGELEYVDAGTLAQALRERRLVT